MTDLLYGFTELSYAANARKTQWYHSFSNQPKDEMTTYLAHYHSPAAADVRGTGFFEFDSDARANSKDNLRDARMRMLELYGRDAVSWEIDKVERQKAKTEQLDGQLELDFRPEKKKRRKRKKEYW